MNAGSPVSSPLSAQQTLDREFLEMRAKILELAASLDRMDRGDGGRASVMHDRRWELLRQGLQILLRDEPDRAERIQLLFSRDYSPNWWDELEVARNG